jgi:hypothetical protein
LKLDNGNDRQERRKKRYFIPIFFFFAELTLAWLVISIIQVDFDIRNWQLWGKILLGLGTLYSLSKTLRIFKRQRNFSVVVKK